MLHLLLEVEGSAWICGHIREEVWGGVMMGRVVAGHYNWRCPDCIVAVPRIPCLMMKLGAMREVILDSNGVAAHHLLA